MDPKERYRSYNPLAWFYDRYWGAHYHRMILPVVGRLLLSALPRGSRIFDLCCGTGHLAAELASRGYAVTGLDGSEEMLAYARRKVPGGEFLAADARSFQLPPIHQAAVSTFESMNHILNLEELAQVFQNVIHTLEPGASFLFDLLTERAYSALWHKSSAIVEEDNVCILRGGYEAARKVGRSDITLFRLEGSWKRSDVTIYERCHSLEEVRSALENSGFSKTTLYDCEKDLGLAGDLAGGRVFFLARKGGDENITAEAAEAPENLRKTNPPPSC